MSQSRFKKDFDKEKMYSKIMPSLAQKAAEPRQEEAPPPPPLREEPEERYLLRNFIEEIVREKAGRTIEMLRGCGCERCKKEVMARALNGLPTVYMVVPVEEAQAALSKMRQEYEVKATAALIKAVQAVKNNPRHQKKEEEQHGG